MSAIMFIILHLLALLFFFPALFVTIPLHIIAAKVSSNNTRNKKILKTLETGNKKYEFVFADMFKKKATWANRDNEWFMLVESEKSKPPTIGEKILVLKEDKTFSYEKVDEVLEYIKTKHLGYRWLCRYVDLERLD